MKILYNSKEQNEVVKKKLLPYYKLYKIDSEDQKLKLPAVISDIFGKLIDLTFIEYLKRYRRRKKIDEYICVKN